MLGLAVGDALGHPTEFVPSVDAIRARWGAAGVTGFEPSGRHPAGTFTDDTQMTVAVARALCRASVADLDALLRVMGDEFAAWSRSAQNNRAPGGTCLAGCRNLARGVAWREAGVKGSKGCGAAMRAAPVGLYLHGDTEALVRVAAAQSALTHAHPTAVASSVAAAAAVAWVTRGEGLDGLVAFTRARVASLTREALLDVGCTVALVDRIGVAEMLDQLDRLSETASREVDDVCSLHGGAWVGEEAVGCALWCVLRAGGGFREAVLRGANSSGDSDSIATIAGSVAGALGGVEAIPAAWRQGLEKSAVLDALARSLCEGAAARAPVTLDPSTDLFGAELLGVRLEDELGGDDTEVDRAPDALRSFRASLLQRTEKES